MRAARRFMMVSVIWGLLSGGAVIVCSSGDTSVVNRAPVARDDDYSVPAGTVLVGAARAVDPDGDALVYRVVSGPTLGRLEAFNGSTGAFRYLSDTSGQDSFEFVASDGRRESGTGRVRIEVTGSVQARALAATAAGPVVLAGGGLYLMDPAGPLPLADGVTGLEPRAGGWLLAGRAGCLDPWSGLGPAAACGRPPAAGAGVPDPHVPSRWLRAVPGEDLTRIEARLGEGPWSVLAGIPGPADSVALHFDLSAAGRAWLAVGMAGRTRLLATDDAGRTWRPVGAVPGRITSLAGPGPGRRGVLGLRTSPAGLVLFDPGGPGPGADAEEIRTNE